ncbi:hypothetical protein KKHLCK_13075 [Candidatus Electrothrix laxa]
MNRQRSLPILAVFLLAAVILPHKVQAAGDPPIPEKLRVYAGPRFWWDQDLWQYFGRSVSLSGDTAVIGAYMDHGKTKGSGSVYVFVRDAHGTWGMGHKAKLTAPDGADGDKFGMSVSIFGDTVVIGAPDDDTGEDSGSAYIFVRATDGTWKQQAKLNAADGVAHDVFGKSVSLSGDTAVIGTEQDDSAYIFVRATDGTWKQQAKLTPADENSRNHFGRSVAVSGDTAVIGAPEDDGKGQGSGSAYIFVRATDGTWKQRAKLIIADGNSRDHFGNRVSLSGDTAIIGTYKKDGSAYIFVRVTDGTWKQQAKLTPADGAVGLAFGLSVSIFGDTTVIGAATRKHDVKGSAYVFIRASDGTWKQRAKLTVADGNSRNLFGNDRFGRSVAVSGDMIVIGAPGNQNEGKVGGSAYIYTIPSK